jgi:hypothetical protein
VKAALRFLASAAAVALWVAVMLTVASAAIDRLPGVPR